MNVAELLTCACRELRRRKGRSLACMAGYTLATAGLVAFCGIWLNAKRSADGVLASTGTHFVAFVPERPEDCADGKTGCCFPGSSMEGFWFNGVPTRLLTPELVKSASELPTVRDASPCLLLRMLHYDEDRPYFVAGVDPDAAAVKTTSCAATDIIAGRFLKSDERGKAVLEDAYAKSRNIETGALIRIGEASFVVVGIVNPGVRPAKADVYITIQDARDVAYARMYNPPSDIYNLLLVEAENSTVQDQSMADIKALLTGSSISTYNCFRPAAQVMGINKSAGTVLLIVIGLSTLLLALKSQWASMIERRRDIAILKTVGWSSSSIVTMLLAESLIQALLGSQIGVLIGQLFLSASPALHLATPFAGWNGLLPVIWGSATALALLGGAIAGIIPALYAVRQWPAEGFRTL